MKKMILIALGVVLFLGINIGITLFLTGGKSAADSQQNEAAETDAAEEKVAELPSEKDERPPIYHPLDPAFVVTFQTQKKVLFMQASLEVMTRDDDVVQAIKHHMPAIRDSLVMLFSSQDSAKLATREGKEELRGEVLAQVQQILEAQTGNPGVESVYFTSFVMQ